MDQRKKMKTNKGKLPFNFPMAKGKRENKVMLIRFSRQENISIIYKVFLFFILFFSIFQFSQLNMVFKLDFSYLSFSNCTKWDQFSPTGNFTFIILKEMKEIFFLDKSEKENFCWIFHLFILWIHVFKIS